MPTPIRNFWIVFRLLVVMGIACPFIQADAPPATFVAQAPGRALVSNQFLVAVPITNSGPANVTNVYVTSAALHSNQALSPTLPVGVGSLNVGQSFILSTGFDDTKLVSGMSYQMTVHGTFLASGVKYGWVVQLTVTMLPLPSSPVPTVTLAPVPPNPVGGPYPPATIPVENEANSTPAPPIPLGPSNGMVQPSSPTTVSDPIYATENRTPRDHRFVSVRSPRLLQTEWSLASKGAAAMQPLQPMLFQATNPLEFKYNSVMTTGHTGDPPEPSGIAIQNMVFSTINTVREFSYYGGAPGGFYIQTNPTTLFPNNVDAGLCCDQSVLYVPSIDRIIWLMQFGANQNGCAATPQVAPCGRDRLRIAAISPSTLLQVFSSAPETESTKWVSWDFNSDYLGVATPCSSTVGCLDFPSMTASSSFLYVSVDDTKNGGLLVFRVPLSDIQAGNSLQATVAADTTAYFSTLVKSLGNGSNWMNVDSGAYWAGHNSNSALWVWYWADNASSPSLNNVFGPSSIGLSGFHSYPCTPKPPPAGCNFGDDQSITPSGTNWLQWGNPGFSINGTVTLGPSRHPGELFTKELWLAWMATSGGGFQQVHIEIARLDTEAFNCIPFGNCLSVIDQMQIQNPQIAYGYPALSTNSNYEVGISLGFGGKGYEATHAVGFVTDPLEGVVYPSGTSDGSSTRWGDYVTIHPYYSDPRLFGAFGYEVKFNPGSAACTGSLSGCQYESHYVLFGRESDLSALPPPPPH